MLEGIGWTVLAGFPGIPGGGGWGVGGGGVLELGSQLSERVGGWWEWGRGSESKFYCTEDTLDFQPM